MINAGIIYTIIERFAFVCLACYVTRYHPP